MRPRHEGSAERSTATKMHETATDPDMDVEHRVAPPTACECAVRPHGSIDMPTTAADGLAIDDVYRHLRAVARRLLGGERTGHTLDPTALVHEVYVRLAAEPSVVVESPGHLVGLAARSMRQVLVNHALRRRTLKRGGPRSARIPLDAVVDLFESRCTDLVALDEALDRLGAMEPRLRQVVELRFFAGLTILEIARLLGRSTRTVERDWDTARTHLRHDLESR